MLKKIFLPPLFTCISLICFSQSKPIGQRVDSVLRLMNLEEKTGRLNQYTDDLGATGPVTVESDQSTQIGNGRVGSL